MNLPKVLTVVLFVSSAFLVSFPGVTAKNDDVCDDDSRECSDNFDPDRNDVRSKLPFSKKGLLPGRPFPRVHLSDLYDPKNEDYLYRRKAFVLTGAADDWPAVKDKFFQGGRRLAKWFPRAVVDFYPMNMLKTGSHPYLFRMKQGYYELMQEPGKGRFGADEVNDARGNPGKYLHLQLTSKFWKKIRDSGAFGKPMHKWFRTDGWMKKCLKRQALVDEYHIKTHWKIILIGGPGAGMFNHSDSLLTSSWHTHLEGLKWWYVCGTDGQCYEDLFYPGDTLFYPKHYYHETMNIAKPSMTVTGTVANSWNYESIATQLHKECAYNHLSFDLSGPLCDALDDCYMLWHERFSGIEDAKQARKEARRRWKPWRKLASRALKKQRDSLSALGNNYDGRNYINE